MTTIAGYMLLERSREPRNVMASPRQKHRPEGSFSCVTSINSVGVRCRKLLQGRCPYQQRFGVIVFQATSGTGDRDDRRIGRTGRAKEVQGVFNSA